MRSYLANYDLFAVSANSKETALNTEQTPDTSLLVSRDMIMDIDHRREDNADELTGKEEPDSAYDLGASLDGKTIPFPKAQAQHFGFGLGYALGSSTPAAWGTGFQHAIAPVSDIDMPSFTAVMRFGNVVGKRRFASLMIDTLKAAFARDSWAKLDLGVKGTGKYTDSVTTETVNAAYDSVSLTLAANGVQGATAAARLDNVHRIRVVVPTTGQWQEVSFSAVSGATPAVITIAAPGGTSDLVDYEILYAPTEPAWCTFPSRVTEPPLRVTDLTMKIGGKWNGTSFLGGKTLSEEVESVTYDLNNQLIVQYRVGGTGTYANYAVRGGRMQTITLNRQLRDWILKRAMVDNEYFGVYLKATGAEFETGKNYYVELIFPRCNVLTSPLSVSDKFLVEAGNLRVMEDDTYGSVIANVGNMVSGYAQ